MQIQIPKLILQPFVENAIDHGLDLSEKEEKQLTVSVREEEDVLIFEGRRQRRRDETGKGAGDPELSVSRVWRAECM